MYSTLLMCCAIAVRLANIYKKVAAPYTDLATHTSLYVLTHTMNSSHSLSALHKVIHSHCDTYVHCTPRCGHHDNAHTF